MISKDTKKLFDVKPHLKLKITEFALLRSWDPFSLGISTAELVRLFLSCQILFSSRSTSLCALRPSGSGMGSCLLLLPQWMREQPARFCHWTLPPPHVADNDNAETCASCERDGWQKDLLLFPLVRMKVFALSTQFATPPTGSVTEPCLLLHMMIWQKTCASCGRDSRQRYSREEEYCLLDYFPH